MTTQPISFLSSMQIPEENPGRFGLEQPNRTEDMKMELDKEWVKSFRILIECLNFGRITKLSEAICSTMQLKWSITTITLAKFWRPWISGYENTW